MRPLILIALVGIVLVAVVPSAWPLIGLAVPATLYLWYTRPDPRNEGAARRWVAGVVFMPILIALLAPALIGALTNANHMLTALGRNDVGPLWLVLATLAALAALAVTAARRWPERQPDWRFLLLIGGGFLLLSFAYVLLVHKAPVSDFNGMWNLATKISQEGFSDITTTRSHLQRVHLERIFPYLLPLNALFGASRWAYVVPNLAATLGSALAVFFLARGWFSRAAARVAFVVALMAPETILATGIPTHDIPGALFTLILFLVFVRLWHAVEENRWRRAILLSAGFGLLLTLADLQRTNRIFLLLAVGLLVLLDFGRRVLTEDRKGLARKAVQRGLLLLLLPILLTKTLDFGLREFGIRITAEQSTAWRYRALVGHSDSWTDGKYQDAVENYYDRYTLTPEQWTDLLLPKILSDLYYNPAERLSSLVRRSRNLFTLGSQHHFYIRGAHLRSGKPVSNLVLQEVAVANYAFTTAFLLLLVLALLRHFRRVPDLLSTLPALYLSLLSLALLLLFQTQPRYLYQIWYVGALYIGAWLAQPLRATEIREG